MAEVPNGPDGSGQSDEDIDLEGFFAKADEVARQSPEKQEEWLRLLAEATEGMDEQADLLRKARVYLEASRGEAEAQEALYRSEAVLAHHSEQMETALTARLRGLLDGSIPLPDHPGARLFCVLELAIMGHFLPGLREQLARPEAQKFLMGFLKGTA